MVQANAEAKRKRKLRLNAEKSREKLLLEKKGLPYQSAGFNSFGLLVSIFF